MRHISIFSALMSASMTAMAYIGPGMGAGTVGVILGILAAVILAFFAILWYPFKRMLAKRKKKQNGSEEDPDAA